MGQDTAVQDTTVKETSVKDMVLPFKILISPLKTFNQLAQKPTAKGLISLSALILVVTSVTLYASATRIFLKIDNQPTSLLASPFFGNWFTSAFATTTLSIVLFWLVFATGLVLISRTVGGKDISWRALFVVLGYILSVFVILHTVRAVMYFALPSLQFESSSWPLTDQSEYDAAQQIMQESWGPLFAYQFGTYFTLVAYVWFVVLSAIAVKALREVSWIRASLVSVVGFLITFFLFPFALP